MTSIPPNTAPELAHLLNQFRGLEDEVAAGRMTVEAARERLAQLTVEDANGYTWALDTEGATYRALPGGTYEAADPSLFASQVSAPSWPGPPSPAPFSSGPAPVDDWPGSPTAEPGYDPVADGVPPFPSGGPTPAAPGRGSRAPRSRPAPRNAGPAGGILARFTQNRRNVVIAAIVVVVVVLIAVGRSHGSNSPTTTTLPPLPPATTTTTSPRIGPSAAPNPSAVWAALTSGVPSTAASAVARPGDGPLRLLETAELHGILTQGLSAAAGPLDRRTGDQTWYLRAGGGAIVSRTVVHWVRHGAAWVLTTWPVFTAR